MTDQAAVAVVPVPAYGRVFTSRRRVRFGEVGPDGTSRLDSLASYVQDIAGEDTADAALADESAWVVRRSVFELRRPAVFWESLDLATFCSGLGGRWAERRVTVTGDRGSRIDAVSLWVRIDPRTGRPRALTDEFVALYGPAAAGRRVSARLQHATAVPEGVEWRPWPLRYADFDRLGHVNNASGWSMVDDALWRAGGPEPPYRAELEYRDPIEESAQVTIAHESGPHGLRVWVSDARTAAVYLTAVVRPSPG